MLLKPGNVDELVDHVKFVLSLSNEQLLDIELSLRQEISGKL